MHESIKVILCTDRILQLFSLKFFSILYCSLEIQKSIIDGVYLIHMYTPKGTHIYM